MKLRILRGFDAGGFDGQSIAGVHPVRLLRRIGTIDGPTLAQFKMAVKAQLGLVYVRPSVRRRKRVLHGTLWVAADGR